jgi:hypothetical protein
MNLPYRCLICKLTADFGLESLVVVELAPKQIMGITIMTMMTGQCCWKPGAKCTSEQAYFLG